MRCGVAALAAGGPLWLSAAGALVLGFGAGLPFSAVFSATQRRWAVSPGSAVAVVNGCAVLTILIATPIAGLTFGLPGDGRIAFAALALLAVAAVPAIRHAHLDDG